MLPSLLIDFSVQLENRDYSDENVRNVVSYWAGYGRGEPLDNATGQYPKKYYDGQEMPGIIYTPLSKPNTFYLKIQVSSGCQYLILVTLKDSIFSISASLIILDSQLELNLHMKVHWIRILALL